MNTNPATIAELVSYINKEVTQLKFEMKMRGKDDPNYDYWVERLAFCEKKKSELYAMTGKNVGGFTTRPRRKKPLT